MGSKLTEKGLNCLLWTWIGPQESKRVQTTPNRSKLFDALHCDAHSGVQTVREGSKLFTLDPDWTPRVKKDPNCPQLVQTISPVFGAPNFCACFRSNTHNSAWVQCCTCLKTTHPVGQKPAHKSDANPNCRCLNGNCCWNVSLFVEIVGLASDANGRSSNVHALSGEHAITGNVLGMAPCIVTCQCQDENAMKMVKVVDGIDACTVTFLLQHFFSCQGAEPHEQVCTGREDAFGLQEHPQANKVHDKPWICICHSP